MNRLHRPKSEKLGFNHFILMHWFQALHFKALTGQNFQLIKCFVPLIKAKQPKRKACSCLLNILIAGCRFKHNFSLLLSRQPCVDQHLLAAGNALDSCSCKIPARSPGQHVDSQFFCKPLIRSHWRCHRLRTILTLPQYLSYHVHITCLFPEFHIVGEGDGVGVRGKKAGKPVTKVQDCVLTFASLTWQVIYKATRQFKAYCGSNFLTRLFWQEVWTYLQLNLLRLKQVF